MDGPRRIKQMLTIPPEVKSWPGLLSPSEINQVATFLGPIGDLKEIETNGCLVEALIHLWDPSCSAFRIGDKEMTMTIEEVASAFRIGDKEMTVTIEEVAGLLSLSVERTAVIFPLASGKAEFCRFTGLRESALQGSDQGISVKFLFDRFANKNGFDRHFEDFTLSSKDAWEHKRPWVYGLVMAGIYLFPREDKKISFKITKLMSDLLSGIGGQRVSIVPTVLADIFVACTNCQKWKSFFHASNRILHMWAMEHFKRRPSLPDGLPLIGYNWIVTHHRRINGNCSLRTALECLDYLTALPDQQIIWVLDWTDCLRPTLRTKSADFIPLLGTQGIMAYTPKRFLRQLGHTQGVPPTPDVTDFVISFAGGICPREIPKRSELVEAWGSRCTDQDILFDPKIKFTPKTTLEYETWLKDRGVRRDQAIISPIDEINRLRALLDAKDRELIQEKQASARYQKAYESIKEFYTETKQDQREKKRKCLELADDINHAMNRYSWESDNSKAQRYGDQLKKVLDCVGKLTE